MESSLKVRETVTNFLPTSPFSQSPPPFYSTKSSSSSPPSLTYTLLSSMFLRTTEPVRPDLFSDEPDRGYALSGKIMLSAIVVLFFVIILMVCLHLYARWYLLRARRRHVQRARNRRTQLVFYVDPDGAQRAANNASHGLGESVLKALPIFNYSSETHPDPIECAVCLSEFEEKETGRTLPKCSHSFHVECIDMWFHTHSTCPLCRAPVEAPEKPVVELVTESGSEVESVGAASTSSFEGRRGKPVELMGVTIEVPRRNGVGFDQDESTTESPAYRSPMSRMLSFKRILSRDRRGSCSSSCGVELDLERGVGCGEEAAAATTSEHSVELNRR